ncbi:auxin-induced protein AUX22 isoform X2 [Cucumis melo]|uniref:Auxin-responsive protein n=1 Tax=Cucumis melo TaxID=3656 RepID=A0A1S3CDC7_CUCME|nr:auxin-induced protein AUX22 isoform X2 [Cucumis melo]
MPVLNSVLGSTKTPPLLLISATINPLVDLSLFPTPFLQSFYISLFQFPFPFSFFSHFSKHPVLFFQQMAKESLGLDITELRLGLGLPGNSDKNEKKRAYNDIVNGGHEPTRDGDDVGRKNSNATSKGQVVGWPPVCSYRKRNSFGEKESSSSLPHENENSKMYVKISMDGAPFLRKLDLGSHKDYSDLAVALEKLFGCFGSTDIKAWRKL